MDTLAVQLTLPTTKRVTDFHRQVTPHAGRTWKITRGQQVKLVEIKMSADCADYTDFCTKISF
jgi:hypothetical protein